MAKSTHTPGPWVADDAHIYAGDKEQHFIAIMADGDYGEWRDAPDEGKAEFEANARLIAAAPDLIHALERLTQSPRPARDSVLTERQWNAAYEAYSKAFDAARAAIAKARGQA